jgi:hypothetical protein
MIGGVSMRLLSAILTMSLAASFAQAPAGRAPRTPVLSDATLIASIDTGRLKGEPTQLGWSPDGSQLYVQVAKRGADGLFTNPRFLLLSFSSSQPSPVDTAPSWASEYWSWKSNKTGPDAGAPEIEVATEEKTASATQSSMGGSTYGGGGVDAVSGTTIDSARRQSEQTQKQRVITLTLSGQTIGRFVDQPLLPGYTFGWSPKSVGLLSYVNEDGRLAVMDMRGGHEDLTSSKNVILPAFSSDGSTIAYLQKTGKTKYDVYTVKVTTAGG